MDKQWQDIHIIYDNNVRFPLGGDTIECNIRQVTIKHIQSTDLFIKINVVDFKGKPNTIIVPKLYGVKVIID